MQRCRRSAGLLLIVLATACGSGVDAPPPDAADLRATDGQPAPAPAGQPVEDAEPNPPPDDPDEAEVSPHDPGAGPALSVSTPGFDGRTVTLGVLRPPAGSPDAARSASAIAGLEAYFRELNQQGGVAGKYPVAIREAEVPDDPGGAVRAYEELRDEVVLVAHVPRGASGLFARLAGDDLLGAPMADDARWLADQHALAFTTPREMQVARGVDWLVDESGIGGEGGSPALRLPVGTPEDPDPADGEEATAGGPTDGEDDGPPGTGSAVAGPEAVSPVCALVGDADDDRGVTGALGAAAAHRGLTVGPVAAADAGGPAARVDALAGAGCRTVVVATPPGALAPSLQAAAAADFAPTWIVLWSSWSPDAVGTGHLDGDGGPAGRLVVVGDGLVTPPPADAGIAGPGQPADDDGDAPVAARPGAPGTVPAGLDAAFGHAQATVVHQVLERTVAMGDMSRGGVVNAANTLDELDLGGLADDVAFGSPEQRRTPRRSAVLLPDEAAPGGLREIGPRRASTSTRAVAGALGLP